MLQSGSGEEAVVRKPFPSKINDDTILKQDKQERVWFYIATPCDWLKKLAPLCHPIRSKTPKTNHDSLAHVFLRRVRTLMTCQNSMIFHDFFHDLLKNSMT